MPGIGPVGHGSCVHPAGDDDDHDVAAAAPVGERTAPAPAARARPTRETAATRRIPANTIPPNHPEYWPHSMPSRSCPVKIHYRPGEKASAQKMLRLLEDAWRMHLDLGFAPPPLPRGKDALDVYVWRGINTCYVSWQKENRETWWDDAFSFMAVDPDGKYGGGELSHTVTHEVSHLFQAGDDWFEFNSAMEGSATFIEWEAHGLSASLDKVLADFQARAHWSIDRDDGGKTWYPYGYAMYLRFLKERYAGGEADFLAEAWRLSRQKPGAEEKPALNEADLADGLERVLDIDYAETVAEFARWRFYTGENADGRHDRDAARIPAIRAQRVALDADAKTRVELDPAPMMLGSSYVEVGRGPSAPSFVHVSIRPTPPAGVRYVLQAVPGLGGASDGEVLKVGADGRAKLRFPPSSRPDSGAKRTLILTAVPAEGSTYDPDTRTNRKYPVTLVLERS